MITGKDIIYISTIEWTFLWQSHQEIATRLAAAGNRVLYIENMGMRTPRLSDAARVVGRLKHWAANRNTHRNTNREAATPPNVHVCSPLVLPPFGPGWRRALNRRFFLKSIRRAADDLGFRDPIIWTYLPTDTSVDLIRLLRSPASLVVYYCVADFTRLTTRIEEVRRSEAEILKLSDLVFASCQQLAQNAAQLNSNVYLSPHGVNLEAFPLDVQLDAHVCPVELSQLPRPTIGYVGGLHRHVDLGLLEKMARLKPDWSWVFVGSVQIPLGDLADLPNVRFLGQKGHAELVYYIREFDVCIVPYANTEATATVLPTKINEYLAVGKPVVATDIPAVREFNELHQVLTLASGISGCHEEFLAGIESALALSRDADQIARRRTVAAGADWKLRLEEISEVIETHLRRGPLQNRER